MSGVSARRQTITSIAILVNDLHHPSASRLPFIVRLYRVDLPRLVHAIQRHTGRIVLACFCMGLGAHLIITNISKNTVVSFLAQQLLLDAEGISKVMTIRVTRPLLCYASFSVLRVRCMLSQRSESSDSALCLVPSLSPFVKLMASSEAQCNTASILKYPNVTASILTYKVADIWTW